MAPKKLSEFEKKEIIQLYGHPEESTSTLASRFGVSSSTISRVLKQGLSDDEYNNLVQQKRTGSQSVQPPQLRDERQSVGQTDDVGVGESDNQQPDKNESAVSVNTPKPKPKTKSSKAKSQESSEEVSRKESLSDDASGQAEPGSAHETNIGDDSLVGRNDRTREPVRRQRRRSRASEPGHPEDDAIQLPLTQLMDSSAEDEPVEDESDLSHRGHDGMSDRPSDTLSAHTQNYSQDDGVAFDEEDDDDDAFVEALDNDLLDEEDDDFSDDLDDDLDDDDEEFIDGDGASDGDAFEPLHFRREDLVQIYPFADADLPRTCYLVIDRSAELITLPLQEFGELGDLPSAELSENTLPVFDNHRVAKRFANRRTQRIVKIPDSQILRKTMPYLQSKGITRLLIDGQVYSLTE